MKGVLVRCLVFVVFVFLFVCVSVSSVLADMRPGPRPAPSSPLYYLIIFSGEFFGFLAGVSILSRACRTRWQKVAITMAVALIASYIIGITVWTSGSLAGIPVYNPLVVSPENQPQLQGLLVTLTPELVGTAVGGVIIRTKQSVNWATALGTMAVAMLTSWVLGSLMINLYIV